METLRELKKCRLGDLMWLWACAARLILLLSAGAGVAHAQAREGVAACTSGLTADVENLNKLMLALRAELEKGATDAVGQLAETHQGALETFRLGRQELSDRAIRRGIPDPQRLIVQAHTRYKEWWARACPADREAAADAYADLGVTVHDLLRSQHLLEPISAALRGGYSLADAGDENTAGFKSNGVSSENTTAVFVAFESKHFMDEEWPSDVSFGGKVGFTPLMAVADRRPPAGTARTGSEDLLPIFQNGFVWAFDVRSNMHVGNQAELSGLIRVGQGRLETLSPKLGEGEAAVITDVIRNDVGRWAWNREIGTEFRFFGDDLDTIHHQKTSLFPLLRLGVGLRWDDRFNRAGRLVDFDSPEQRWFFNFSIDLTKVAERRVGVETKTYELRVTVDHEASRKGGVPSGTRLMVEAGADLMKLIRPGGAPPATR